MAVNLVLFVLLLHDLDHVVRQQEPTSGPGGALPFGPGSYWVYEPGASRWALVVAPMLVGLAAIAVGRRAARAPA